MDADRKTVSWQPQATRLSVAVTIYSLATLLPDILINDLLQKQRIIHSFFYPGCDCAWVCRHDRPGSGVPKATNSSDGHDDHAYGRAGFRVSTFESRFAAPSRRYCERHCGPPGFHRAEPR